MKSSDEGASQLSPAVGRVAAVLNFLAEHPEDAFTLSEIARSLRLSSATCHNLLTALVDVGYVYRTAAKTYLLGPGIARLGVIAMNNTSILLVARPEMRLLADEFDVVCSASFIEGEELIVRARAASVSHLGWKPTAQQRKLYRPPVGLALIAWADEPGREAWLGRADPPVDRVEQARLNQGMEFVREHGFTFGDRPGPWAGPHQVQSDLEVTDYVATELSSARAYQLGFVAAPVFSAPGVPALVISLAGFAEPVTGEALKQIGARLRMSADRLGDFLARSAA